MSSNTPAKNTEKEMSFFEHLDELRSHLMRSVMVTVGIAVIVFVMGDLIFEHFLYGPTKSNFLSYRFMCWLSNALGLGDKMCMTPPVFEFDTKDMGESFFVHIKTSFILGLAAAFPFVFREIWLFVKPGLHQHEAKAAGGVVGVASALFLLGVLFGYFIIAPFAVKFLIGYEIGGVSNDSPTLSSYVNYILMFMIPTGVLFQLPLVVFYLAKIGLVTPDSMRKYRRHAFLFIIILAAIVTPPDAVTQFLIAMPIYGLYEISINIAERQHKKYQESLK